MNIKNRAVIFCKMICTQNQDEFESYYAYLTNHHAFEVWNEIQKYRPIEIKECNSVILKKSERRKI